MNISKPFSHINHFSSQIYEHKYITVRLVQDTIVCPKMSPKNYWGVHLFFQTLFWQAVPSIFFLNSKRYRTMLQDSFSEQPDPPTSLPCFILFIGYLLSKESNTSCLYFVFKIIFHQAPVYLSELLHLYTPLHPAAPLFCRPSSPPPPPPWVFRIPSFQTKSSGQHNFSYQAPVIWN